MIVSVFPSPAANTTLIRPLPSIPTLRKLPSAKLVGSGIAIALFEAGHLPSSKK